MTPFLLKWAVVRGQSITLVSSEKFPFILSPFVCRDRLLLLSRYLISFSRNCLLVLDRGISNEEGSTRAVIKIRGPWIPPVYYERGPWLLSLENRGKIEKKKSLFV